MFYAKSLVNLKVRIIIREKNPMKLRIKILDLEQMKFKKHRFFEAETS